MVLLIYFFSTSYCLWGFCVGLCFGLHTLRPFKFCNHLKEEEREPVALPLLFF